MSSLTWAIGSAVYSRFSETYSPFAINFLRALLALPLFIVAEFCLSGTAGLGAAFMAPQPQHYLWLLISMISSYALGDAFFFLSTRYIGITSAMAIASIYPLWLALAQVFVTGSGIPWRQFLGVVIVVGGVVTVILSGRSGVSAAASSSDPARRRIGILAAFLTSWFWAMNSFAVSRGGQGISPFVGNAIRMVYAMVLCRILFSFFQRRNPASPRPFWIPFSEVRWKLWIFAFEAFGGSAFFLYGLSHSPLAISGTLSSLAPVLSVPIGLILRIEQFSWLRTLGVLLVGWGTFFLLSPSG